MEKKYCSRDGRNLAWLAGGRVQLHWSFLSQQCSREMTAGGNVFLWWTIPLKFTLTADSVTVYFSSSCGKEVFPSLWRASPTTPGWNAVYSICDLPCGVHKFHDDLYIAKRTHQLCAQEPWQLTQTFLYAWAPLPFLSWHKLAIICRPMAIRWKTAGCHFCYMEQIPERAHKQKKNKHCLILTTFIVFP